MKKLVEVQGGEIYAIPLFLSNVLDNKSFSRDKFKDRGKEFVFCRIITDKGGGGIFIEVFDLIGHLKQSLESIISSKRLFRPIAVSGLGIYKKRWKKLYVQEPYDKEKDSKYSEIQLVLGVNEDLRLFQNGEEIPINDVDAKKYEMWNLWRASQLEKRIIEELSSASNGNATN